MPTIKDSYIYIGIIILSIMIYSNTMNHGFVLDDSLSITGNSFVKKGFEGISDIWAHDYFVGAHGKEFELTGGRYRPLPLTTFSIGYEFWGLNAKNEHIINILLFSFCSLLLFIVLSQIFGPERQILSLIATLLFVCHPIHTEVVANIKSRDEILALIFCLGSLGLLLQKKMIHALLSALLLFLAFCSKEISVAFLFLMPLIILLFTKYTVKHLITRFSPHLIIFILYILLRSKFSAGFNAENIASNLMDNPFLNSSSAERLATCVFILFRYVYLLITPTNLSFDYSFKALEYAHWTDLTVISTFTLLIVFSIFSTREVLFVSKKKKEQSLKTIIALGFFIFIVPYSIISNVFFNIGTFMGERFLFLPSLGFCIVLATLLFYIGKKKKVLMVLSTLLILAISTLLTVNRNKDWKSNFSLYEADVNTVPNSARSQMFYGIELLSKFQKSKKNKTLSSAINHLKKATIINPEFYHAHYNLGLAYQSAEDHLSAIKSFKSVLKIQPKHINSHFYLGLSLGKGLNQLEESIKWMEKGIEVGYNGDDAYSNLGVAYGMNKRLDKALHYFLKALEQKPKNEKLLINIGVTYQQLGDADQANKYFDKAKLINPDLKFKSE